MEEISVKTVSSKVYKKRKKRILSGVIVKKQYSLKKIKNTLFYATVSVLFYLIIFSFCTAIMSIKSLWYETLIKPPIMLRYNFFMVINAVFMLLLMYVFYKTILIKDKGQIISLIINGVFYTLLAYMFYGLKSPLGSFVIIIVLLSQTITIMYSFAKSKKLYALFLLMLAIWQIYNLFVVYTILMLN